MRVGGEGLPIVVDERLQGFLVAPEQVVVCLTHGPKAVRGARAPRRGGRRVRGDTAPPHVPACSLTQYCIRIKNPFKVRHLVGFADLQEQLVLCLFRAARLTQPLVVADLFRRIRILSSVIDSYILSGG